MHNSLDGRKQNTNVVMSKQYAQLPCVACTSNSYFDTEGSDYKLGTKELVRQTSLRRLNLCHTHFRYSSYVSISRAAVTLRNMNHNRKHNGRRGNPTVTFVLLRDHNACELDVRFTKQKRTCGCDRNSVTHKTYQDQLSRTKRFYFLTIACEILPTITNGIKM